MKQVFIQEGWTLTIEDQHTQLPHLSYCRLSRSECPDSYRDMTGYVDPEAIKQLFERARPLERGNGSKLPEPHEVDVMSRADLVEMARLLLIERRDKYQDVSGYMLQIRELTEELRTVREASVPELEIEPITVMPMAVDEVKIIFCDKGDCILEKGHAGMCDVLPF